MMRRLLALVSGALLLAGCDGLDREGMLLPLDPGYTPELLLSDKDGIASPDGLLWEEGRLYIADEGGSALRLWEPGRPVQTLAGPEQGLKSPEDVVRGADGALWFTDDDAGGVWRYAAEGGLTHQFAGIKSSEALAAVPGGGLLVGDGESGRLVRTAAAAQPLRIAKPESLAWDGSGNLYIADNKEDVLYLLTRDGRLHRPIAAREGFSPESLHFADGALFITDSGNGKLYRYTPEEGLRVLAVFAGELANLQGVTTDADGNIYVSVQSDLKGRRGYVFRLSRRAS